MPIQQRQKLRLQTSEPELRLEVITGGYGPQIDFIHSQSGRMVIGHLSPEQTKQLAKALKDLVP